MVSVNPIVLTRFVSVGTAALTQTEKNYVSKPLPLDTTRVGPKAFADTK